MADGQGGGAMIHGGLKLEQCHGKSKVRLGRVWKDGNDDNGTHHFVEWKVSILLLSDCLPAYVHSDNSTLVSTDAMKNIVYVIAKECSSRTPAEVFAIRLAEHFTTFYKMVTSAVINITEKQWDRVSVDGQPHKHGFKFGAEKHTAEVVLTKSGTVKVTTGIEGVRLLKTTQSGFEGFLRDKYTILPETQERLLGTEVTASWRYGFESLSSIPMHPEYYFNRYIEVRKVLMDTFFGPPEEGVYSTSVQATLYNMAKAVLNRFPEILSVQLKMPNIHFLPVNLSSKVNPGMVKFEEDVYFPTDEPHGVIEASLSRIQSKM